MKNVISKFLQIGLSLILGVYLTWFFFDQMSENSIEYFYQTLYATNYWIVGLSLIIGIITYWSRAYRWKYTLEPLGYFSSSWNRYHSLMIGYIVNLTIPRAGEASRAAMLKRSDNIPFSVSFGTIITERLVDIVFLLLITCLTMILGKQDFWFLYKEMLNEFGSKNDQGGNVILIVLIVFFVASVLVLLVFPALRTLIKKFLKSLVDGILSIFKLQHPWYYLMHTLIIWGGYILMFALPYYALNETIQVPFEGILMAFLAGSIGISFTNGGIGTYPLLVGYITAFYLKRQGIQNSLAIANALGMIIWASQAIIMIIMGLISLFLLPRKYMTNE